MQNYIKILATNSPEKKSFRLKERDKKFDVFKLQETNKEETHLKLKEKKEINCINTKEIILTLLSMGFHLESICQANRKYHFTSLEQAVDILLFDTDKGVYNHEFVPSKEGMSCEICSDEKKKHFFNKESLNETEENNLKIDFSYIDHYSNYTFHFRKNNEISFREKSTDSSIKIKISSELIDRITSEFEKGIDNNCLCCICYSEEITKDNSYSLDCGHVFCKKCVRNYLAVLIKESKVDKIFCMKLHCERKFKEEEIRKFCSSYEFIKYKKFKERIFRMKNNSSLRQCPHPDCDEQIKPLQKDSIYTLCKNQHYYCILCKGKWRYNHKCVRSKLEEFVLKNEKIKLCPKCNNFVEKTDDINYLTCSVCQHQFCWLCLKKYKFYHYYIFYIFGCPGLEKEIPSKMRFYKKFILRLLTIALGIIFGIFYFTAFLILGCSYELVEYYFSDKITDEEKQDESQIKDYIGKDYNSSFFIFVVVAFLILIGIVFQPFYLLFKIFLSINNIYRKFGCICTYKYENINRNKY